MEDQHLWCADLSRARLWDFADQGPASSTAMFGVFDGHGGDEAAVFTAANLPKLFSEKFPDLCLVDLSDAAEAARFEQKVKEVFEAVDETFLDMATDPLLEQPLLAGTTAVLVWLHSNRFISVANLGDSRAVLCRGGDLSVLCFLFFWPSFCFRLGVAIPLSEDQKPGVPAERERIEASGGWVTESLELDVHQLWRLNPRLLESKSIPQELAGSEVWDLFFSFFSFFFCFFFSLGWLCEDSSTQWRVGCVASHW